VKNDFAPGILTIALASMLAGCSDAATDQELSSEVKLFASTAASVRMMAVQWQMEALPDQFARRAIPAANMELAASAGRAASRVMELKADPRDLLADMTAAMTAAARVSQAVEQGNRAEVKSAVDELSRAAAKLRFTEAE
jgi:hypothetical protein